jgi:Fe-S cluster biogenesis protein NfuA
MDLVNNLRALEAKQVKNSTFAFWAKRAYELAMVNANILDKMTCQFQFDKDIAKADFAVDSAQNAAFSPVAKRLFGFPWVDKIVVRKNSLELTKKEWVDWDVIVEPLLGLLEEHFSTVTALEEPLPEKPAAATSESDEIRAFIENQINPSLASHGGFVEMKSFDNNVAYLSMGGGCQGCASSQATMVDGIETALKSQFPFVQRVVDVTDHAMGDNPYY